MTIYGRYIILKSKLALRRSSSFRSMVKSIGAMHTAVVLTSLAAFALNVAFGSATTFAANETGLKPALFYLISSEFTDDQELVTETFSESAAITEAEENYLRNLASVRVQQQIEMRAPQDVAPGSGDNLVQGGSAVVQPNIVQTNKTKRQRTGVVYHTVQAGETVSTIAQEYEISVSTILW